MASANESDQGEAASAEELPTSAAPAAKVAKRRGRPAKAAVAVAAPDPVVELAEPELPVSEVAVADAAVPVLPEAVPEPVAATPARKAVRKIAAKTKPAAKPKPVISAPEKPVKAPKPVSAKVLVAKSAHKPTPKPTIVTKAALKTAPQEKTMFAGIQINPFWKESKMDMSATLGGFQEAVSEAQIKAKEAFEKSQTMLGEVGDFTKGNVEAVIESGKILAGGMQEIGTTIVAEGKTAFEAMTADIKEMAAAKSPTDFFKLQSEMMKKSVDSAVAYGSKNSETMLKLMSDVMAPISGRMSVAMEKARQITV